MRGNTIQESFIFPHQPNTLTVVTEYLKKTVNCLIWHMAFAFILTALWNIAATKAVVHKKKKKKMK